MDDAKINISTVLIIWFLTTLMLAAVFLGAGLQGEFTIFHTVFAGIILSLAVIGTPLAFYFLRDDETDIAKAKREKIDTMLRDMSDDELLELKQRLSTGDYDEDALLDYVSDDGELVMRS
ncbi:MAG: hypothetical protein Phog2KO_43610 [Phototrophicaceae bacterium]